MFRSVLSTLLRHNPRQAINKCGMMSQACFTPQRNIPSCARMGHSGDLEASASLTIYSKGVCPHAPEHVQMILQHALDISRALSRAPSLASHAALGSPGKLAVQFSTPLLNLLAPVSHADRTYSNYLLPPSAPFCSADACLITCHCCQIHKPSGFLMNNLSEEHQGLYVLCQVAQGRAMAHV